MKRINLYKCFAGALAVGTIAVLDRGACPGRHLQFLRAVRQLDRRDLHRLQRRMGRALHVPGPVGELGQQLGCVVPAGLHQRRRGVSERLPHSQQEHQLPVVRLVGVHGHRPECGLLRGRLRHLDRGQRQRDHDLDRRAQRRPARLERRLSHPRRADLHRVQGHERIEQRLLVRRHQAP